MIFKYRSLNIAIFVVGHLTKGIWAENCRAHQHPYFRILKEKFKGGL